MNQNIIKIISSLITVIAAGLAASRNDPAKVAEVKQEADKQIDELEGALKEGDGSEFSELRSNLDSVVTSALAARAPTTEQIQEVGAVTSKLKEDFNRQARQAGSTPLPPSEVKPPEPPTASQRDPQADTGTATKSPENTIRQ